MVLSTISGEGVSEWRRQHHHWNQSRALRRQRAPTHPAADHQHHHHHHHHSRDHHHHNCNPASHSHDGPMLLADEREQEPEARRRRPASQTGWWRRTDVGLVLAQLLLLLASQAVAPSLAYPSGAPDQACKDLKPGHGVEPQAGASPFELSQDRLQVGAGEQIKVTLSSPSATNFKGLIVQANNEAGEPRGKFLPGTGLKTIDSCSAVTHSDKEAKKTATLVWQAPGDLKSKEAFVFKATVVKKFDEIYTNIKSSLKSTATS